MPAARKSCVKFRTRPDPKAALMRSAQPYDAQSADVGWTLRPCTKKLWNYVEKDNHWDEKGGRASSPAPGNPGHGDRTRNRRRWCHWGTQDKSFHGRPEQRAATFHEPASRPSNESQRVLIFALKEVARCRVASVAHLLPSWHGPHLLVTGNERGLDGGAGDCHPQHFIFIDGKLIYASAWEPCQELFQGVARCLRSDFRLGGLPPGDRIKIRGKMYLVPADPDARLARYARDFPEHLC